MNSQFRSQVSFEALARLSIKGTKVKRSVKDGMLLSLYGSAAFERNTVYDLRIMPRRSEDQLAKRSNALGKYSANNVVHVKVM